jgi:hypothetical protein
MSRYISNSRQSNTTRPRRGRRYHGAAHVESLEGRRLLAAAIRAIIPDVFTGTPTQLPLGDTVTQTSFQPGGQAAARHFLISTDDAADGQITRFVVNQPDVVSSFDAALALFDASGNQLQLVDADATPGRPGLEIMEAVLQPKTAYVLGVYAQASVFNIRVGVSLPQQASNAAIVVDPGTGTAALDAVSGEDPFNTPADPDYYRLDFINGKADATVSVSGNAPDVRAAVGVLRETTQFTELDASLPGTVAWQSIGTASGSAPVVSVAPVSGRNLADDRYMLWTAPEGLNAPARAYRIDVSSTTLAQAAVDTDTPIALGSPLPTSLGVASITRTDSLGAGKVYSFTAQTTGAMTFEVASPTVGTRLSIYDATGATLLKAAGRTTATGYSISFDVTAGTTYRVALAPATGSAGTATLKFQQAYQAQPASAVSGAVVLTGISAGGATGAKYYRVSLPPGADVLSVRLAPSDATGGAQTLRLIGNSNAAPVTRTATAGEVLNLLIDARTLGPQVDIAFTSESDGAVDFSAAAIVVPKTLSSNLPLATVDLQTGDLSADLAVGAAGLVSAVKYYGLNTGTTADVSITGTAGASAVLAQYEAQDGVLRLTNFTLPDAANLSRRVGTINPGRLVALAAISARPDGASGTLPLVMNGALPLGVGIAMATEPVPPIIPGDPPIPPGAVFTTNLRVRNGRLDSGEQRDLWETIVPNNVTGAPKLSIGPSKPGGALALSVTVLDASNAVLQQITTTPGQSLADVPLSLTPASIAGQKLRVLVEPIGTNLGEGQYTLSVSAVTSNPLPYLVTESSFSTTYVQNTPSIPFFESIRPVTVNSFADSSFTSSGVYNATILGNTGSIDVFRFTQGPSPFAVQTEVLSGNVNTNIKLYKARYSGSSIVAYDEVSAPPSFDYYPADRSTVDARIEFWNTDIARDTFNTAAYEPGRNTWYVVAKNEAGSLGSYRLRVSTLTPQQSGPGTTPAYFGYGAPDLTIDPRTGDSDTQTFVSNGQVLTMVTPSTTSIILPVSVTFTPTVAGTRSVRVDLLDSLGNVLRTSTVSNTGGTGSVSLGNLFQGPSALTRYFVRVSVVAGSNTAFNVSASVFVGSADYANKPGLHGSLTTAPGFSNPSEPYVRANQFADGTFVSSSGLVPSGSGLKHKVVFWVDRPGRAQLTLTSSAALANRVLGLWRAKRAGGGEFQYTGGDLVDFNSDAAGTGVGGTLTLNAELMPGAYYLTVDATTTSFFQTVTVAATQLPAPISTLVELDPNSGTISSQNLNRVDPLLPSPYALDTGGLEEYRTSFYKVVTPGGSQAGLLSAGAIYGSVTPSALNKGRAAISITRLTPTIAKYTGSNATIDLDGPTDDLGAIVQSTDLALPGNEYYIGVNRDRLFAGDPGLHISAQFTVPQSGTPDIVVKDVKLSPANGRTLVTVELTNAGFASVGAFESRLRFSNYPTDSVFTIPGMGPLSTQIFTYLWDPTNRSGFDTVTYTADISNMVAERNEGNNAKIATLAKYRPTISSIALADPLMDQDVATGVWGRYVAGVPGQTSNIIVTPADADGLSDIYQTYLREAGSFGQNIYVGTGPFTRSNFDFGSLRATSATNPNRFEAYVRDQWGLTSDTSSVTANVVAKSGFFNTFTFDRATRTFNIAYDNDIVSYDKSISQILGSSIPLIGDKRQKFILHIGARGTATLNPATPISLPLGADINLTAFDTELYKANWTGSSRITDNFMVGTTLDVSGRTLDVTAAAASFQLRNLQLLNVRTPKIPLFSFGIPGVAALSANFSLGLKAGISAGLKIGLNPNILNDPLNAPLRVGLMSPTFVQPRIEGSAYISGDVEVLGIDLASLEGRISLGLNVTVGIDNNDPSKVIPFSELADRIKFNVTGDLSFGLSAHVFLIGEVWSWDPDPITFPLGGNTVEGIITNDPGLPGDFRRLLEKGELPPELLRTLPQPKVRVGSDLLGAYDLSPAPQLVIDPVTGYGLTVQVADSDPSAAQTRGQLVFATRADANAAWSSLSPIVGSGDVANPQLVSMGGGNYMVVYEVIDLPVNTQSQTLNARFVARDLRYRIWNGTTWSSEQSLTAATGGDSQHAVAFDSAGRGVSAWVHNGAAVALNESGQYARAQQDIAVSIFDDASQQWSAPQAFAITGADSQPAVYMQDGVAYAAWIHETATGNELWASTNDGSGWTTPAPLSIGGLDAGGKFTSVAIGSEANGKLNLIFNYRSPAADGSLNSRLYNRPTPAAGFLSYATVEVIAEKTNFSTVRTTNAPDGSLLVSWKAADGITNDIFGSVLRSDGSPWSTPKQLTQGTTVEQYPSVAFEPDGTVQVLYEIVEPGTSSGTLEASPMAPNVGGATASILPELGFVGGLEFGDRDSAVAGSTSRGTATIVNRGLAPTTALVEFTRDGAALASRSVLLAPGQTFDVAYDYTIVAGAAEYGVRLSTTDTELVGTADNIVTKSLNGLADIEVVSLQLQDPSSPPSATNPLVATIRNNSSEAIGAFDLDFRSGDELFPQAPWASIGVVNVPSLAGGETVAITQAVDGADVAGAYTFSVYADAANAIAESTEGNNRGSLRFTRAADPGLAAQSVVATLLDSSGVDNVRVDAQLFNFATGTPAGPVTVRLLRRIGEGEFVQVASQQFTSIAADGVGVPVSFTTAGLAGNNIFRVVVDPDVVAADSDPLNNVGEASLQIRGLADLAPQNAALSQSTATVGSATTITVDIANLGIAAADNVLVEVIARTSANDAGVTIGSTVVATVGALSSVPLTLSLNTSLPIGTYSVSVVVDRVDESTEVTEANNTSNPLTLNVIADPGPGVVSGAYLFNAASPAYQLTFDEAIAGLDSGDLSLVRVQDAQPIPAANLAVQLSADGRTARIVYTGSASGVLPDGDYQLAIAAGAFSDAAGNPNTVPVDEAFFVLAGDANRDRRVNFDDLLVLAANYNQSPRTFSQGDFTYDGRVNFDDLLILASRYNTSLSAGPVAPPPPAPLFAGGDDDGSDQSKAPPVLA